VKTPKGAIFANTRKTTMSLFSEVKTIPTSASFQPVRLYLEAQDQKDFRRAKEFFADDVYFNGLVLKARGCERVAAEMSAFISAAIEYIALEAIAEVEPGRFLALYQFKLKPASEAQFLCDHIVVKDGRIVQVDNVFDAAKLPPM